MFTSYTTNLNNLNFNLLSIFLIMNNYNPMINFERLTSIIASADLKLLVNRLFPIISTSLVMNLTTYDMGDDEEHIFEVLSESHKNF